MSFLVAINGQFTPLAQSLSPKLKRDISPSRAVSESSDATNFKQALEEGLETSFKNKTKPNRAIGSYQKEQQQFEEKRNRHYARDIMSSPVRVIKENALTHEARNQFFSFGFRHLPVVNAQNMLIGMLSERHLTQLETNPPCSEVMDQKVVVAEEHTSIHEIALILLQEKLNALPIVNHHREVTGIITLSDILKYVIFRTPFLTKA